MLQMISSNILLRSALLCIGAVVVLASAPAIADVCGNNVNISYRLNYNDIETMIKEGRDPCPNWVPRGGLPDYSSVGNKTLGNLSYSAKSKNFAHDTMPAYKDLFCTYREAKAGGESDDGARTSCDKGVGTALFSIPPLVVNVPVCGDECDDCANGLFNALSGGGTGDAANAFQVDGEVSQNGCAAGSIGVCGIGVISGNICADGPDGSQEADDEAEGNEAHAKHDDIKHVEVTDTAVFQIVYTENLNQTTVYVTNGGYMEVVDVDGNVVEVEINENGHVTIDENGYLYVGDVDSEGTVVNIGYDDDNPYGGIDMTDGTIAYVNIMANDGLLHVDETYYQMHEENTLTADVNVNQTHTDTSHQNHDEFYVPEENDHVAMETVTVENDASNQTDPGDQSWWMDEIYGEDAAYAGSYEPLPEPDIQEIPDGEKDEPTVAQKAVGQ